jgi:hypothetical protein
MILLGVAAAAARRPPLATQTRKSCTGEGCGLIGLTHPAWASIASATLRRRGFASPNYSTSVMSRRPPAATKPMPTSSPSVIAIAMPPSRTNSATNTAVYRLNLEVPRKRSLARLRRANAQVRWTQEPPALLRYWCSATLPGPDRPTSAFPSCGLTHQRRFRCSAASLPQGSSVQAQFGAIRSRTMLPRPRHDLRG